MSFLSVRVVVLALLASAIFAAPPSKADERGLVLGRVRELRLSGRIVEFGTGAPLAHAEVMVENDRVRKRFVADYDGTFSGVVEDASGLGLVTVIFAHSDRRAKDLDTVSFELVPKTLDAAVTGDRVRLKAKKLDLDLGCGGRGLAVSSSVEVAVAVVCDEGLAGVEYSKEQNRFAVLAAEPFSLRVGNGRVEVRGTQVSSVTLRTEVALRTR
jgi:hypothetical protein